MSETIRWWLVLQLVALPLLPLCLAMFRRLPDRGFALSKPFALLMAALLGACNAPDLASYDPHVKFGAEVVQKTAVLFLDPAPNGAVMNQDRPRLAEFAKDFRDRNAGPIGIAVGATSATDPAAVAFAEQSPFPDPKDLLVDMFAD